MSPLALLKHWRVIVGLLGPIALFLAVSAYVGHKESLAYKAGETFGRNAVIKDNREAKAEAQKTIQKLRADLFDSLRALSLAKTDHKMAQTKARQDAQRAVLTMDAEIARLKGQIDEQIPLQTLSGHECLPDRLLRVHADIDTRLTANRRSHRDADREGQAGSARPPTLPIAKPALAARIRDSDSGTGQPCLSLAAVERRTAYLGSALIEAEGRLIALYNQAKAQYEADLALWEAEAARIADVESRIHTVQP